ncbi:MAG TPA: thymidine phosphorylase [Verrucomicrobiae bacterium]|nr:thymidine phosphorylase [Verrucomicrobiae bacterium]
MKNFRVRSQMNFLSLIESKREGAVLAPREIHGFIREFTSGKIPDYQMAAMLMAIYFRGLDAGETRALMLAMRDSGDVLKFPKDSRPLVDKHSTGGIGDAVSLPLAPLLACLGFRVPMISGRSLGITGGTLDKLDSIPGFKTSLRAKQIVEITQKIGCVICGQTERMIPADKKLYALRDSTGTVPSIPLIASSVLSKKLSENLDALVLDVKFGRAAFMQTKTQARELARVMVSLGNECGVRARAILTNMDSPLARAAGNWLEIKEAVSCLEAKNPSDLQELVLTFAAHLLVQTKKSKSLEAARKLAENCLASGAPRRKWDEMLAAQGADLRAFRRKLARDHMAPAVLELKAASDGIVSRCDARIIGEIVRDLGGGRLTKESKINHDVGVDRLAKPGDEIRRGAILARIHARDHSLAESARKRLKNAIEISRKKPAARSLVAEVIER